MNVTTWLLQKALTTSHGRSRLIRVQMLGTARKPGSPRTAGQVRLYAFDVFHAAIYNIYIYI